MLVNMGEDKLEKYCYGLMRFSAIREMIMMIKETYSFIPLFFVRPYASINTNEVEMKWEQQLCHLSSALGVLFWSQSHIDAIRVYLLKSAGAQ